MAPAAIDEKPRGLVANQLGSDRTDEVLGRTLHRLQRGSPTLAASSARDDSILATSASACRTDPQLLLPHIVWTSDVASRFRHTVTNSNRINSLELNQLVDENHADVKTFERRPAG